MIYLQLFITFFYIGMFGFGGGNAMISLIQFEIVERYGWITNAQFTNIVAVSQATPGPIGINCATYTGYLSTGTVWGAIVATIGMILPPFIIVYLLTKLVGKVKDSPYYKGAMQGLRPAIIGLILAACLLLMTPETFGLGYSDWKAWLIFASAFVAVKWLKLNPILLIFISGLVGLAIY